MAEEFYIDQMHKWENVWSTIKQLSKEEIAKIPKEFLRTSKIPEHKVKIKKWERSEEIVDNFEVEQLSNIILYDVDMVMENTEDSSVSISTSNNITSIDQEKAAELMATPVAETSINSSENTSQQNDLTISNTIHNSMSNTSFSNSTSTDSSSERTEQTSTGNGTNSNLTNGSSLKFEILPETEQDSSIEKLPLKKTSTNNEEDSEHADKRIKLDDGNIKEVNIINKIENDNSIVTEELVTDNNSLKRKADQLEKETESGSSISNEIEKLNKPVNENISNVINKEDIANKIHINATLLDSEELKPKQTEKHMSLFDDQGYIILNPFSLEDKVSNVAMEESKIVDVPSSNENKMDIDGVENFDKLDNEQSVADSSFGLKSYNSTEFSSEGSYKKVVASIEDSNVSTIYEVSSINNEDLLDQSSSVSSSNVKRIIERLENNSINNELSSSINSTIENNSGEVKLPEKFDDSKTLSEKSEGNKLEQHQETDDKNHISSGNENEIVENKITNENENEEKKVENNIVEKETDINIKIDKDDNETEGKKEAGTLNKVNSGDLMDVDDKPKEGIIGGSVIDKIKLFEKNVIINENSKENEKEVEAKLQEVNNTIDKQVEENEVKVEREGPSNIVNNSSFTEQEKKEINSTENVVNVTATNNIKEITVTKTEGSNSEIENPNSNSSNTN
ncbi:hypothetical protein BCR36DRAFT_413922 [Piromyces finnis]|uniref:Uncharacterized protein n=1 Tax=Piromyces finnis TaxID=1754191 RepID=A0A1Y1V4Q3_9FUNG|nr:hypothetical protein BCR36DRAFT_413922 [Piromyces finnis]|eukprot:ORX46617.1 hypothetical protein BCR36DRAFT_413922 [Piromyces finnis]